MVTLNFYTQVPIKVKRLRKDAVDLKYAHPGDSGMDVFAVAVKRLNTLKKPYEDDRDKDADSYIIMPGETVLACSGWAVSIPLGTELQARPTSGNGLKTKIRIPNAPGTIDSKYRGEIGIELENIGTEPFVLKKGAKVAQLVLCPVLEAVPQEVDELDKTTRGADGYGSTGTMADSKFVEYKYETEDGEIKRAIAKDVSSAAKNPIQEAINKKKSQRHSCSSNCDGFCDGGCH